MRNLVVGGYKNQDLLNSYCLLERAMIPQLLARLSSSETLALKIRQEYRQAIGGPEDLVRGWSSERISLELMYEWLVPLQAKVQVGWWFILAILHIQGASQSFSPIIDSFQDPN